MIDIDYLADHPEFIDKCAEWAFDTWGRFNPNASIEKSRDAFLKYSNKENIPITWLALENGELVGMVSLKDDDGLVSELKPWLASLYVAESSRGNGIAEKLIEAVKAKAALLGNRSLYLYVFEAGLKKYYSSLGWEILGKDSCKGHNVTVMKIDL